MNFVVFKENQDILANQGDLDVGSLLAFMQLNIAIQKNASKNSFVLVTNVYKVGLYVKDYVYYAVKVGSDYSDGCLERLCQNIAELYHLINGPVIDENKMIDLCTILISSHHNIDATAQIQIIYYAPLEWKSQILDVILQCQSLLQTTKSILGLVVFQDHYVVHYSLPSQSTMTDFCALYNFVTGNTGAVCVNISDVVGKGEGIVKRKPRYMSDYISGDGTKKNGWVLAPHSKTSVFLDREYGLSAYKSGYTTTVLLYNPDEWASISSIRKGFPFIRNIRVSRRRPNGCKGYLMYNEHTFSTMHSVCSKEVALKMSILWQQCYKTKHTKNKEIDCIDHMIQEDGDEILVYLVKLDWFITVALVDLGLVNETVSELLKYTC